MPDAADRHVLAVLVLAVALGAGGLLMLAVVLGVAWRLFVAIAGLGG